MGFNRGRISHSHADGEVSGKVYAGGLVGYNRGEISYSAAEGPVSSDDTAGGLVGYSRRSGRICSLVWHCISTLSGWRSYWNQ